jgi:hypothetical protein
MIYFVQCGTDGPIKIGCTQGCVVGRVRQLQGLSPHEMTPLCAHEGDRRVEHQLHKLFAAYRIRGEWFEPAKPILDHIKLFQGLDYYNKLHRPDLRRAVGRSLRKLWPQDLKDRFKALKGPRFASWVEGRYHLRADFVEPVEQIVFDPRIAHLYHEEHAQ